MNTFWQDLRYGARMLLKKPRFTLITVLTLALGIGANTAIFSVVNAVLLQPLPYREPERLVMIWESALNTNNRQNPVAPGNYNYWRSQSRSFADMAAYVSQPLNLIGSGEPERVSATLCSDNLLQVMGVPPLLGTGFVPGQTKPGEVKGVVISHGLWQRRFGGDPAIVGKDLKADLYVLPILGVMPASFRFPYEETDVWLGTTMSTSVAGTLEAHYLQVVGRLNPGLALSAAQAEMQTLAARLQQEFPKTNRHVGAHVQTLHEHVTGNVRQALWLIFAAAGLVLLITCANVANLLLVRASGRQKEIAVRLAVGARRWRLVRQLLTESLLLALAGGAAGLLLALWGVQALVGLMPENIARAGAATVDWQALGFTLIVSLLTGLLFGLVPGWQATRPNLNVVLKEGGRDETGARAGLRNLILIGQVALALIVLVGAGLLINSFVRLRQVDSGLRIENMLTLDVFPPYTKYPDTARRAAFYDQMLERVSALPGVTAAGFTSTLPLKSRIGEMTYLIERQGALRVFNAKPIVISRDYFQTTGVPLLQGRGFTTQDQATTPGVVILNEAMAQLLWPGAEAVGKQLKQGVASEPWLTVIGVVKNTRFALTMEPVPEVYRTYSQISYFAPHELVVRTSANPLSFANAVRQAIWSIDKDQAVANIRTMEQVQADSIARQRFNVLLVTIFAALALALAVVGIYGVMSYTVSQNTRELGIRMALGAQAKDVLRLVIGQGVLLASLGVALGLAGAIGLTRLLKTLLFGVTPTDPLTFASVALLLLVVALLACWIPARRAARVDPMIALRCE
jgi:putative ABC transport system permease protein